MLGQDLSTPSLPGRRAAARAAVGSSLSWWSTSSSPSWGSRAKRVLAKRVQVPSARRYRASIRSMGSTQYPVR